MLQRSTQIGEFYRMHPPPVWDKSKQLPPTYMDILIYDEEADKHQHIQFETALKAAASAFDNADLAGFMGALGLPPAGFADVDALIAHPEIGLASNPGWFTGTTIEIKTDVATAVKGIIKAVKAGMWMPLCIVIARPFIEHLAMSAIMTVSGRDTGATLFGPADMQISANTSVKTIEGCAALSFICTVFYAPFLLPPHLELLDLGTGSRSQTHRGSSMSSGMVWNFRNNAARKSVSERGIRPNSFSCNSAFSPDGPTTGRVTQVRPIRVTHSLSMWQRRPIASISTSGMRHSSRSRCFSSTTAKR